MAWRVLRHPAVEQDLIAITELIANYSGPEVALRIVGEFEAVLGRLGQNPRIGTIRNEIFPGRRAIPVGRKGVIAFVVDEELHRVLVVAFSYAGSDWSWAVAKRTKP